MLKVYFFCNAYLSPCMTFLAFLSRAAGNASYSKRIQKTVVQRKLKLHMDEAVRMLFS